MGVICHSARSRASRAFKSSRIWSMRRLWLMVKLRLGWWSAPRPGRGPFALELDVLLGADARCDELDAVLRGRAVAVAVATAEELHRVGDDVHRLSVAAVLLPLAPLQ